MKYIEKASQELSSKNTRFSQYSILGFYGFLFLILLYFTLNQYNSEKFSYEIFIMLLIFFALFPLLLTLIGNCYGIFRFITIKSQVNSFNVTKDERTSLKNNQNFIRISTLFTNYNSNEIFSLLNDFSIFGLLDKNITNSEKVDFSNENSSAPNNHKMPEHGIKKTFYSLTFKVPKKLQISQSVKYICHSKLLELISIERESFIIDNIKNPIFIIVDYIKDPDDDKEKILRIFCLENLQSMNCEIDPRNINGKLSTLVTVLLPLEFYEKKNSTIELEILETSKGGNFDKDKNKISATEKLLLFQNSLKMLDKLQIYLNNNFIRMRLKNNFLSHYNNFKNDIPDFIETTSNRKSSSHNNNQNVYNNPNNNHDQIIKDGAIPDGYIQSEIFGKSLIKAFLISTVANNINDKSDYIFHTNKNGPKNTNHNTLKSYKSEDLRKILTKIFNSNAENLQCKANNNYNEGLVCEENGENTLENKCSSSTITTLVNKSEVEIREENIEKPYDMFHQFSGDEEFLQIVNLIEEKMSQIEPFLNRKWNQMELKKDFISHYYDEPDGLRSIKSEVIINKNFECVKNYILDLDKRKNFNKTLDIIKDLRKFNDTYFLKLLKTKGILILSPREFLFAEKKIEVIKITIIYKFINHIY